MLDILDPRNIDLDELSRIQKDVANKVIKEDRVSNPNTIAGCDISFSEEELAYAACVSFTYPQLEKLDSESIKVEIDFPYIPTFLAFRELKPMLRVVKNIDADVYMIDSQGLAHPRRAGLASHLGVVAEIPTIGVAKNRLCGEAEEPDSEKGSYTYLRENEQIIGAVVRTRKNVNPVYVSIGHKLSLEKAIEITLKTAPKYKIPEPIRAAHKLATRKMKETRTG
ncbi:hypothetical protein AKJ37_04540 [candidate division MSBL1 archaeon SCGC-AAA259I09]|uniref:Endonuclease V n=1 Tax=candidate division MSBL1 archaeon SCGC-AAA259I09 TaxID=1698267 RepID=A0A133UR78_9EURY|nr:hypothetical protein AKJ37_04540 [candidate division MSBL1 archaeon SCGC-AAA259I09]